MMVRGVTVAVAQAAVAVGEEEYLGEQVLVELFLHHVDPRPNPLCHPSSPNTCFLLLQPQPRPPSQHVPEHHLHLSSTHLAVAWWLIWVEGRKWLVQREWMMQTCKDFGTCCLPRRITLQPYPDHIRPPPRPPQLLIALTPTFQAATFLKPPEVLTERYPRSRGWGSVKYQWLVEQIEVPSPPSLTHIVVIQHLLGTRSFSVMRATGTRPRQHPQPHLMKVGCNVTRGELSHVTAALETSCTTSTMIRTIRKIMKRRMVKKTSTAPHLHLPNTNSVAPPLRQLFLPPLPLPLSKC